MNILRDEDDMPKYNEQAIQDFIARVDVVTNIRIEYEEEHVDAGDAYSHMVSQSRHDRGVAKGFREWLDESGIERCGVPFGKIFDLAVENFKMTPDHLSSNAPGYKDCFVLASYPVGEMELDMAELLSSADVPFDALPQIKDHLKVVVNDGQYGYYATDATWVAYIPKYDMQMVIDCWVNR
jgi:hypothetical protein